MEREKQRERKIKTKRWKDDVTVQCSNSSNTFYTSKFVGNMIEWAEWQNCTHLFVYPFNVLIRNECMDKIIIKLFQSKLKKNGFVLSLYKIFDTLYSYRMIIPKR